MARNIAKTNKNSTKTVETKPQIRQKLPNRTPPTRRRLRPWPLPSTSSPSAPDGRHSDRRGSRERVKQNYICHVGSRATFPSQRCSGRNNLRRPGLNATCQGERERMRDRERGVGKLEKVDWVSDLRSGRSFSGGFQLLSPRERSTRLSATSLVGAWPKGRPGARSPKKTN